MKGALLPSEHEYYELFGGGYWRFMAGSDHPRQGCR